MVFGEARCVCCQNQFRYPLEFGVVRYCSATCRVACEPPVNTWEYKGCVSPRYYSRKRRRRMTGGDRIDPLVVYVAFDWTCWLCHDRIDPTVQMPDGRCATIDHIVPLSLGGKHVWENVAPAHKDCNEFKDTNDKRLEGYDSRGYANSLSRPQNPEPMVQGDEGIQTRSDSLQR